MLAFAGLLAFGAASSSKEPNSWLSGVGILLIVGVVLFVTFKKKK